MTEWDKIQAECHKLKVQWYKERPICILCLQRVHWGAFDLVHKIRRSETSNKFSTFELQTMKKNTGPGHRMCHDDYDNHPEVAKSYPGFKQIMRDIMEIDIEIFNKITNL